MVDGCAGWRQVCGMTAFSAGSDGGCAAWRCPLVPLRGLEEASLVGAGSKRALTSC